MGCKGCTTLRYFDGREECGYTLLDVNELINCPCKECLVKVTCEKICADFKTAMNSEQKLIYKNLYAVKTFKRRFF